MSAMVALSLGALVEDERVLVASDIHSHRRRPAKPLRFNSSGAKIQTAMIGG